MIMIILHKCTHPSKISIKKTKLLNTNPNPPNKPTPVSVYYPPSNKLRIDHQQQKYYKNLISFNFQNSFFYDFLYLFVFITFFYLFSTCMYTLFFHTFSLQKIYFNYTSVMNPSLRILTLFIAISLFIGLIESKPKVTRIDDTNFDKFSKDGSYWIIQISNTPCNECQSHEKELLDASDLLDGVCKIGKVDAKFLKGMQIPSNPTYLFLRSDKIQENVQFPQKKITRTGLAKFCLAQIEKAVKKRHKTLFGDQKNTQEPSGSSQQSTQSNRKYDGTKIIDLTDQNFEKSVLQSKQAWFVLFYSPSCGHCRSLEPEFEKLPGLMGKKVNIARIDATVHSKMAQKYQIRGFPTMFLFESDNKQKPITYEGQRTAEEIKSWLSSKKLSKAVKQLHQLTRKNYQWNCNRNIICLIFILDNKSDKSQIKFIKPLLQQTIQKPIQYFYSQRLPQLQGELMIEDRGTPKMVATWEGINSYRIYNGGNNYEDLNGFIDNLMERRRWIKFERKSLELMFGNGSGEL